MRQSSIDHWQLSHSASFLSDREKRTWQRVKNSRGKIERDQEIKKKNNPDILTVWPSDTGKGTQRKWLEAQRTIECIGAWLLPPIGTNEWLPPRHDLHDYHALEPSKDKTFVLRLFLDLLAHLKGDMIGFTPGPISFHTCKSIQGVYFRFELLISLRGMSSQTITPLFW